MDHRCKAEGCTINVTEDFDYCIGCRNRLKGCEYFQQKEFKRAAGSTWVPICGKDGSLIVIEGGLKCDDCEEKK